MNYDNINNLIKNHTRIRYCICKVGTKRCPNSIYRLSSYDTKEEAEEGIIHARGLNPNGEYVIMKQTVFTNEEILF